MLGFSLAKSGAMTSVYQFNFAQPHCQWWLAITSPQISYGRHYYDYHLPGMKRADCEQSDQAWRDELTETWGIETREQWLATLFRLLDAGVHGQVWQAQFGLRACLTASQWQQRIHQVAGQVASAEMRYLDAIYRQVGVAGFKGWDFCRGSFLTRAGWLIGVLSADEFAYFLNHFSVQIQHSFTSWEHYFKSFIFGRNYWQYVTYQDEAERHATQLLDQGFEVTYSRFFASLRNDADAFVFDLAWDTPLPDVPIPDSLVMLLDVEQETAT